ncbi:hypothetical protein WME73_10455 [Sorangium sp. So ce302]|uniref:hypothetical protein n=1 Tax=Sorangium sp. So ce302 TaxID=3133297 RepID=UPI003F632978
MRTSLAIGLLLSVSISSLLVGSGCTITLAPDPDPPAGSTGGEGGNADPGAGGGEDPGSDGDGGRLPPPPSACWLGDMGDGFTCHDTATLRDHAQARCARMGAELASFVSDTLNPSCAEHESSEVVFECCGGDPPPPPPPNSCWKGELGDGSSCIDLGAIKDRAYAMCESAGATLTWLDAPPDPGRCGTNEATKATFECCGSTPPPPPPRACWKGELGDRRSCVDPSVLKDQAYAACSRTEGDLTVFDYERNNPSCAAHETTWGYFECCGNEPPPPPPPPPSGACWKGELGDGLSCVDRSVMKDRAYATCTSAGARFTSFSYEEENPRCTGYETSKAYFECCGAEPPPPPEACWGGSLGDGSSCIDASALKERAYATCASDGAVLTAFDYANDGRCAAHEANYAKFACCASTTPPPR